MSVRYSVVVFDWEGTISDMFGPVLQAVISQAHRLGYTDYDMQVLCHTLPFGLPIVIKKVFHALSAREQKHLLSAITAVLSIRDKDVYCIPGAIACCRALKDAGSTLAIATNKSHASLLRQLQASELEPLFSVVRSASVCAPKPAPDMLCDILQECDVKPEDTVMIGDSTADIIMAREAGVEGLGFDFYHQQTEALLDAGALLVFHTYEDLSAYLLEKGS